MEDTENGASDSLHGQSPASGDENKRYSVASVRSNGSLISDDLIGEGGLENGVHLANEADAANESFIRLKERQKTFDKINRNMERNTAKWKRLQEQMLYCDDNDESYSHLIDGRINEIKSMCCSLIRPEYILDSLSPNVKEYALSLVPIGRLEFQTAYRANWTKQDLFRFSVRMVQTYSKIARAHIKYPWWEDSKCKSITKESFQSSNILKYSINKVLRQSLTTNPTYRSNNSIQQILWFNRAIGAFADLFSVEMEKELARYISYEIYDDNRVIRCQGDVPHKLYYILAGKIEMVRVYRLSEGQVHKSMGFLTHKQMSDFECFEMRQPSPTYLVARGRLEVLSLHYEDYTRLSSHSDLDAIKSFLEHITIFKDLAIDTRSLETQQVRIHYYKHDKVISSDSRRDTYLYIVKSGKVSVARRQTILSESATKLMSSADVYSIGCRRDGKHASDMLGISNRQKTFKQMQLEKSKSMNIQKRICPTIKITPQTIISKFVVEGEDILNIDDVPVRSKTLFEPKLINDVTDEIVLKEATQILSGTNSKSKLERQTYVKLDTLKPFDIFGLDSIEGCGAVTDNKLVLISEGAEVLMINKRYFMESVNNNTLLEIRKLIKSYLSEEEAKVIIDDDKKWKAYKKILMERMITLHC